jgi:hypothetical protein
MTKTNSSIIVSLIGTILDVAKLVTSLFMIWLTLGWKVRKARKAFEGELRKQGMQKQDAQRLGARYAALKGETINAFKRSFRFTS